MKIKQYRICYDILNSLDIYNLVGPWDINDLNERKEKRKFIYEDQKLFFDNLEKNILLYGIKNPIIVTYGTPYKDFKLLHNSDKKFICAYLGGSRLWIAQKHNLMVPCFINDFIGDYPSKDIIGLELYKYGNIKNTKYKKDGLYIDYYN